MAEADRYYVERMIKTMLWLYGGFRVYLSGDKDICAAMQEIYSASGNQSFDFDYMANVYEHPFEVVYCDAVPEEKGDPKAIAAIWRAAASAWTPAGPTGKVSAVVDGEPVFSEEVVWFPKINSDPDYHYDGYRSRP